VSAPRTISLPLTGLIAVLALAGCSAGGATNAPPSGQPSPEAIERNERKEQAAALGNEESSEAEKQREMLSQLESKQREEAAELTAKHTEARAKANAKKREKAADQAAKHKEEAAEKAAKQREAAARSKSPNTPTTPSNPTSGKRTTGRAAPKESIGAPPTVGVPSGSN
jgi:membrane protein involved in colicin uptake